MAQMNISLPDTLKDWVDAQARTSRYGDASDYVRDLIQRDRERSSGLEELQRLVTEGLESGESDLSRDEILSAARARHASRHS